MDRLLRSIQALAALALLAACMDAFLPEGVAKEGVDLLAGLLLALAVAHMLLG